MNDEYVVYVLYSKQFDRTYTGYTSNLIQRFRSHNYLGNKGYTKKYRPWYVLHVEFFETKSKAQSRELFLKSGHGRAWVKNKIISSYKQ
jgi:putative endonuclease